MFHPTRQTRPSSPTGLTHLIIPLPSHHKDNTSSPFLHNNSAANFSAQRLFKSTESINFAPSFNADAISDVGFFLKFYFYFRETLLHAVSQSEIAANTRVNSLSPYPHNRFLLKQQKLRIHQRFHYVYVNVVTGAYILPLTFPTFNQACL